MKDVYQRIYETGIIPVIKIDDAKDAVPLAKALIEGGLPAAEITFRTDAAEASIKAVAEAFPEMLVGAGTVLTIDQAKRAKEAGIKIHLVIETEDAISKILSSKHFRYDKASKINPKSFMMMFLSLCNRYNISVWYCNKKDSARIIHDLLFVYAREYLKNL